MTEQFVINVIMSMSEQFEITVIMSTILEKDVLVYKP